ncbi:major facilitator superfamily protein [Stylonychia lemnae]|uniref:Major facilitator superfamily protein n=1 Tax=Stylonychia lemnae TaxID=5949 RepID=A0A077ZSI5_STYLE|nr:major facilitator superfamily protein [Stylonychia lemnae]|eukprot:CDW72822.1 major facilitator superfamily protein [Stylonychia lemnae]
MIAYLPVNFPSVYALDKWGSRYGVLIGIFLTTVGLWLRCLINYNFIWAIIGQTVLAIAQPFTFNAPAKISANWFGEKERLYSTSVAVNANTLGVAIGYFIPALFVKDQDEFHQEDAKNHTWQLMMCVAAASTAILIPVALSFKDKPPSPPSYSQVSDMLKVNQSLKKDLASLIKNKGFMLACFANGGVMAFSYSFTTLFAQMISIYGFTASQSSWIGTTYLLAGMVGGILASVFLTYKPNYRFCSIFMTLMTLGTCISTYFAIISLSYEFLMVTCAFNGFFCLGIFTVAYELAVEMSFPIGEATSGGLINSISSIFGISQIMAITPILERAEKQDVMITTLIFSGMLLLSLLLFIFTKFDLARIKFEQQDKFNNTGLEMMSMHRFNQSIDLKNENFSSIAPMVVEEV